MMHIIVNIPDLPDRQLSYIQTQVGRTFVGMETEVRLAPIMSTEVRGIGGYDPSDAQIAYAQLRVRMIVADAMELE